MDTTGWPGVHREGRELYTINAVPGVRVYGETLRTVGGVEYRGWDPFRSKMAAFLACGAPSTVLPRSARTLYLGGAHGTTVSHLSDLWPSGTIYIVEKSPTSFAPLLALARRRTNLLPLLADAQLPERYRADVGPVDFLYQDLAQRNQSGIFLENAEACLRPGGQGILMLKVRSVTQRRAPAAVVREVEGEVERAGFSIDDTRPLTPFSRDHAALALHR